jgi:hypothetical protein
MRTSGSLSLFTLALALYVTPFVHASGAHSGRQLSDQNLFEVHLQQAAASSHKRLPSEVLNHHERDDAEELAPAADAGDATTAPSTSADATDADASAKSYTARQPSHFIKHFKHRRLGKRRLSDESPSIHFERDSEDLDSSVWQVPALVARAFDVNAAIWQRDSATTASSTASAHASTATPSQPSHAST